MGFALAPQACEAAYGLVAHDTIGSTSADALERLRAGAASPFWVVSLHQSQGRGRRGTAWQTQPGNLAASLAITTKAGPATIATLGFVAGVALVRALETCCALHREEKGVGASFALKWPNDVLVGGAKLAGILIETETLGDLRAVVIGIGTNVIHAPGGLAYPTTSLAALGFDVSAETLFVALSAAWIEVVGIWDEGRGFAAVRDLWLDHAAGLGKPVVVRAGSGTVSGIFQTIDPQGQLVLRNGEGGLETVAAGEVYFGAAATVRPEAVA